MNAPGRWWILSALLSVAAGRAALGDPAATLEPLGVFIRECTLPGETRKDDVVPRHANCIQVSRDRWLVIYSTHGYRGVDDERSIVYQLRRVAPDGPVIREGFLARGRSDFDAAGDGKTSPGEGKTYFKQHGHMVAFGVPKGAFIGGQPAPHANVFVAKWRSAARVLDLRRNFLEHSNSDPQLRERSQAVEWVQFRLNAAEDDLEILQPARVLRQQGFATGAAFTSAAVAWMNQSFTPPVPFNAAATEWADCNHFDQGRVAALKYRFNAASRLYEWVETGPLWAAGKIALWEASLAAHEGAWILAARSNGRVAWARTANPFAAVPSPVFTPEPVVSAPLTVFTGADGGLRLFTGDRAASPQRYDRDPLYVWEVNPAADFAVTNRQVIFDSVAAKLPMRAAVRAKIDFCELFPPHGRTQLIVHGVSTRAYHFPYEGTAGIPAVNAAEQDASGLYYARLSYGWDVPASWRFGP